MAADDARTTRSLDATDMPSGLPAEQVIGRPDRGFAGIENRTGLLQSLERLSEDDRRLLQMYFGEERRRPRSPRCWAAARCRCLACCARRSTGCAARWSSRDGRSPV